MVIRTLLFNKKLHDRIMSTMTNDITKLLAATAEEIVEVSQVCTKGIRKGVDNTLEVLGSDWFHKWRENLIEETAHALVMLTGLIERFEITEAELEFDAREVCRRYERRPKTEKRISRGKIKFPKIAPEKEESRSGQRGVEMEFKPKEEGE